MGRILALVVKELLALLRDPKGRMVLIGPPVLQLFIFSYAATLEVSNVRIGLLDRDNGAWSAELLQRLEASDTFAEIVPVDGVQAIDRLIDQRRVIAVLHVGPTFSRDLMAGSDAAVQLLLDGRRSNAAQIVDGYVRRLLADLNRDARARAGLPAVPDDPLVVRHWFNPTLEYQWFTVPSLLAMLTMLMGLIVTSLSVARERELGTFDQLLVSPLTPAQILAGKSLPPLLVGLFHGTLFLLAAIFIFRVPFTGSLALLYGSLVVYLAAVIGIGLFISSLCATQQQAILGSFLFAAPAVLLSGFATPVENMPEWLQTATLINPLRHFLVIVKGLFLKDMPLETVAASVLPLALIALVTLGTAAWLFRRRLG